MYLLNPFFSRSPLTLSCICKRLRRPGIDSASLYRLADRYRAARQHRLVESIPWNRFLDSYNVYKFGLCMQTKEHHIDGGKPRREG
jgi:hypothetical protein